MSENTTAPVEAVKLTRAEKLAARQAFLYNRIQADTAEYHSVTSEINNAAALASVTIGSVVQIKLGRKFADKDTTRIVEATVVAAREVEGDVQYKVSYGEGFDAETAVIEPGKIVGFGPIAVEAAA